MPEDFTSPFFCAQFARRGLAFSFYRRLFLERKWIMLNARKTFGIGLTFALGLAALFGAPPTAAAAPLTSVSPYAGDYCGTINGRPMLLSISESGDVSGVWESGYRSPYDLNSLSGTVAEDGTLDVTLSIVRIRFTGGSTKTGFPKGKPQRVKVHATGFVEFDSDGNLIGMLLIDDDPNGIYVLDLIRC
jgi:hypothetical protein